MEASLNSKRYQEIENIPNDQYVCTKCDSIPEIISIDYNKGIIEFKCKTHDTQEVNMREYFEQESKFLYYNVRCDEDKTKMQKEYLSYIFNHFIDTKRNLCENCSKGEKSMSIKINEINNICPNHIKKYIKYCQKCNIHFCSQDDITCRHIIEEIKSPENKEIDIIKKKIQMLINYKEMIDYQIKFLNTLLMAYEKHPSNYYNSINITNVAKDLVNQDDTKFYNQIENNTNDEIFNKNDREKLLSKIKDLESVILNELNSKLEVNLTGKELEINLNGKKVENLDLELLCAIHYNNLEIMDLSNNNISNLEKIIKLNSPNLQTLILKNNKIISIEPLKNIKSSNLKNMDLSYNEIQNIKPIKMIIKNNKQLEIINLENNKIKDVEVLKNKNTIAISIKQIKLDNNDVAIKDIKEIYNIIAMNNTEFITITYTIPPDSSDIKLFGENFVEKNKDKCKIIINDSETELCTNYSLKGSEKTLKVKLKLNAIISDMSLMFQECSSLSSLEVISQSQTENVSNMHGMFSGCSSLSSLEGISKWKTENVTDMSYMFHECSSLSSLSGISNWQTGNVSNMSYMFYECTSLSSLEGISKWQTGKVTNMNGMFSGCSSLLNLDGISNWHTGKVSDMSYMFKGCFSLSSLVGISKWKTESVNNMIGMFRECSALSSADRISEWKIGKATEVKDIFFGCSQIKKIPRKYTIDK